MEHAEASLQHIRGPSNHVHSTYCLRFAAIGVTKEYLGCCSCQSAGQAKVAQHTWTRLAQHWEAQLKTVPLARYCCQCSPDRLQAHWSLLLTGRPFPSCPLSYCSSSAAGKKLHASNFTPLSNTWQGHLQTPSGQASALQHKSVYNYMLIVAGPN